MVQPTQHSVALRAAEADSARWAQHPRPTPFPARAPEISPMSESMTHKTGTASAWAALAPTKQLIFITMFSFSWIQCWADISINVWHIANTPPHRTSWDLKFTAPLAVLLVGVLVTNVLGFLAFRKNNPLEARLALVDLDSPYVVASRGSRILRGEKMAEWEELQWRNALWRSLPLACLKLWMVLRVYGEIPVCQHVLFPSIFISVATSTVPEGGIQEALGDTWQRLSAVHSAQATLESNSRLKQMREEHLFDKVEDEMQNWMKGLWYACHCQESTWSVVPMDYMAARRDYYFPTLATRPEDSKMTPGQLGTGCMDALNERFRNLLTTKLKEDPRLMPKVIGLTAEAKPLGARLASWALRRFVSQEAFVDLVMYKLRRDRKAHFESAKQSRGWRDNAPQQSRPKQRWMLFSATVLMLSASRSISAKLCQALSLEMSASLAVVVHGALDVTLMVVTLLLASTAQPADKLGKVIHAFVKVMHEFMFNFLEMLKPEDIESEAARPVYDLLAKNAGVFFPQKAPGVLHNLHKEALPEALAIEPGQLGLLILGVLLFLLTSTAMAAALTSTTAAPKRPLAVLLDVGLTGPLRLLMDGRKDVRKFTWTIPLLTILRGILCSLVVVVMWRFVDKEHMQTSYAMVFNDVVENSPVPRLFTSLVLLQIGSGLVAYALICCATSPQPADHLHAVRRSTSLSGYGSVSACPPGSFVKPKHCP